MHSLAIMNGRFGVNRCTILLQNYLNKLLIIDMKNLLFILAFLATFSSCQMNKSSLKTYCNPVDLNYRFCLDNPSRRESADPTMIRFKDYFLLFPSKAGGYYVSTDLIKWDLIETNQIPTEEYAPTVVAIGDTLYFLASSETKSTVYKSTAPLEGKWSVAVEALEMPVWDPALFLDDDGRLYLYWGCSNVNPLYAVEVDYKNNFKFIGKRQETMHPNPAQNGWEVPGDYNTRVDVSPWIEGSWVTKVNGKYYLQYAGPGTEYKSYADAVYVSDSPLGPFHLQPSNPFAYKPEGFVAGGGHGSSLEDANGNRWQIGAVTIAKKHMFERRLALFPVFIDRLGTLHASTKYGDYPQYMPTTKINSPADMFTGWMLLNYKKDIVTSSTADSCPSSYMDDEDIRTYWSAKSGNAGEYAIVNLGALADVYALQVNFAEDQTTILGRPKGLKLRYTIESSKDGVKWEPLIDQSKSNTDNSHPYFQLEKKVACQFLKITNIEMPTGRFAISGFRVFGLGHGVKPGAVEKFTATRSLTDRRKVQLNWEESLGATGYVINYGISKDQLYQSYMVYSNTSLTINSLSSVQPYYFTIEAFNENGITANTAVVEAK